MTLWIIFAVMTAAAAWFLFAPIRARIVSVSGVAAAVSLVLAFGVYYAIGSPTLSSTEASPPDVEEMVESLATRLQDTPDDIDGWKMLGRSYLNLRRFADAAGAFREAVRLEDGQNAQTLVDLGETLVATSGQQLTSESISLFENALKLEPNNPSALFWGGIAAANRNDIDEAADRWEVLLGTNPPPEIRTIIEQRISEWRAVDSGEAPGIEIDVQLAAAVPTDLPGNTPVFVIARDPQNPSPPIAVARRQLAELPGSVVLTDRDAMIPGRELSRFASVEVIVRIALGGTPAASPGDWFGEVLAAPGDSIRIEIAEQTP